MYRLFQVTLLISISFLSCSQNGLNQISFVDSLGRKIEVNESYFVFNYNEKLDSVKLDDLYNNAYTKAISINNLHNFSTNSVSQYSTGNSEDTALSYCVTCFKDEIKIVDSIDINSDGVKELFLYRKWNCSARPPVFKTYGVGVHQQNYSQYEVWDIKTKKRIFEVKNRNDGSVAVSTNVGRSYGYRFKVDIDKKGNFVLSDFSGEGSVFEVGKYSYDKESGEYREN